VTWVETPLGELCSPKQWPTLSKANMLPAGVVVYGANGPIGYTDRPTHNQDTILVGCRGSCGALHVMPANSYANGNAMALDNLRTDKVDLRYLARFLARRGFADVISGSSQPQIIRSNIVRVGVPLPSIDEQRRIAALLDKADELRQERKRAIALLDDLNHSLFLETFGDPVSNPFGFPTAPLEQLVSPTRKITYGILMPGDDQEDGVPYVRVTDIQGGEVLVGQLRRTTSAIAADYKRSTLKAGDLLISIRGHVGRMAIAPPECEGANITQDTARLALVGANPLYGPLRSAARSRA
jgi:type I restriction enzyme, S subunit